MCDDNEMDCQKEVGPKIDSILSALDLLENNSDNGGPSADHNSDQFGQSLHELLGRNASLDALLLDNCDALEQSFAELGQLEDDFDAFRIYSMVNNFKSRLRAKSNLLRQKSIDENNEARDDDVDVGGQGIVTAKSAKSQGGPLKVLNESDSFDDYGSDSSESTDEISYSQRDRLDSKIKEREAVEERLKRKMDGSDNAFPPSKNEVKQQLGRKMKESAKPSSIPPSEFDQKSSESRKLMAKESFEERLKKKMGDSTAKVPGNHGTSSLPTSLSPDAIAVRSRQLMAISESDAAEPSSPFPPLASKKLTAKESFEERLKKKMIDSDTGTVGRNNGTSNNDKLDRKIKAREAKEERLRKKMAESESDAPFEGAGKLTTAKVSFDERLKNKMTGSEFTKSIPKDVTSSVKSRKLNAIESFEERLKIKMAGESATTTKVSSSSTSVHDKSSTRPLDRFAQDLMRGLSDTNSSESDETMSSDDHRVALPLSASIPTKAPKPRPPRQLTQGLIKRLSDFDSNESDEYEIIFSSDHRRDRLDRKIRKRKALEERLKRKMAGSNNVVVPSSKNAVDERVKRKMKESVTKPSLLPPIASQTPTAIESFEERLKKKMSDPDTVVRRGSSDGDKLDRKIKAREATEERLRTKMAGSHAPMDGRNDERVRSKMIESESTTPIPENIISSVDSQKLTTAKLSFDERLKIKMKESTAPYETPTSSVESRKVHAKESLEGRLIKNMAEESATIKAPSSASISIKVSPPRPPKQFTQGLLKRISDFDSSESDGSVSSNHRRDRLDKKIQARKALEERLKRSKIAGSDKVAVPSSNNAVEGCVKSKMKESAKVSPLPPVASRKPTAKESFEDRSKKKMTESNTAIAPSSIYPPPKSSPCPPDRFAQFLMGSVSDSESSKSADEISCSQRDRLDRKIKAREAAEERAKQKMAGSENAAVRSSKKAIEERTRRKMKKSTKQHSK